MTETDAIFVSLNGRQILEHQLEVKRRHHKEICAEREIAHELSGDGWHDNPHFNYLQQMEANATHEIAQIQALLQKAKLFIVPAGPRPTDTVQLGSIVTVLLVHTETDEEEERTFEIVGYQEGDKARNQVAYNVPLAARLMGLEEGDSVPVRLPTGLYDIEVVELHEDPRVLELQNA